MCINKQQVETLTMIFKQYLRGNSLAQIVALLSAKKIPSPSGNTQWTRATIDKLLSNEKYVPQDMQRKATRYNSQNVLSGLLVCAECGANYRRITSSSGKVAWRCVSRVEHGKELCRHSPTISEAMAANYICEALGTSELDPQSVRKSLNTISDIARNNSEQSPGYVIQSWMRSHSTIEFLRLWEQENNPNFNTQEFTDLQTRLKSDSFTLTPKQWIERTGTIGITSRQGKNGGTYAHPKIAYEFLTWVSPKFKPILIKAFQVIDTANKLF